MFALPLVKTRWGTFSICQLQMPPPVNQTTNYNTQIHNNYTFNTTHKSHNTYQTQIYQKQQKYINMTWSPPDLKVFTTKHSYHWLGVFKVPTWVFTKYWPGDLKKLFFSYHKNISCQNTDANHTFLKTFFFFMPPLLYCRGLTKDSKCTGLFS